MNLLSKIRPLIIFFMAIFSYQQLLAQEETYTTEMKELNAELDAGSFLLGYELNNGSSIQVGYNLFFNANYDGDLKWSKIAFKAGYNPTFEEELVLISAGYAYTRNLIAYRADISTYFSDGKTNIGINPNVGLDILLGELYIGYNAYIVDDIPGLEDQVTFSANINFSWAFLAVESFKESLRTF